MARLFRSACACVLVFGFCSVFSLGVNASEQQLNSYDTLAPVVVPSNPSSVNSNSGLYKWTVNYNPPEYSSGELLVDGDSIDFINFSDVGYTVIDKLWSYSSNGYYHVVRFIDAPFPSITVSSGAQQNKFEWQYPVSDQIWTCDFSNNGSYGIYFGRTDSTDNLPLLKTGERYLLSVAADAKFNGQNYYQWQLSEINGLTVLDSGRSGYVSWWLVETSSYLWPNKIYASVNYSGTASSSTLKLQSVKITHVTDDSDVVDAINNQTNEINQNHQDTMDKIDDVTDFDDQEQSDLTGAVDGASDQINEKLGILSFGDHVLDQFIGIFDAAAGSPGITLPGFSIQVDGVQHVVWTDQVFDLSTIEDKFGPLMTAVHFATSFLVYAALVMYVQKIFGAIMQDWSDK